MKQVKHFDIKKLNHHSEIVVTKLAERTKVMSLPLRSSLVDVGCQVTFALISLNQFAERFYHLPYTRYFEANAIRFVLNEKKIF